MLSGSFAITVVSAFDHLLTATVARGTYERDLRRGINRFRWVEYSFSATLMVILIGFYSGITDITAVVAVAGANVGMILFGEKTYLVSRLAAKPLLAWQIYFPSLDG